MLTIGVIVYVILGLLCAMAAENNDDITTSGYKAIDYFWTTTCVLAWPILIIIAIVFSLTNRRINS